MKNWRTTPVDWLEIQGRVSVVPKSFFLTSREIPRSRFGSMADGLLSLFYPESCFTCAAPMARHQDCGVCDVCWKKVLGLQIHQPWCAFCGLPFQTDASEPERLCIQCSLETPPFSGARSYGYYTSELSQLIQALKFRGRSNLIRLLAPLLAGAFMESWDRSEFDWLVPVPLHPRRKRARGYNQAALLAHSLGRAIGLPCCESALSRIRHTQPQVGLSDPERFRNLERAFRCLNPGLIERKRVLLVDDVMTTGATVASASQALLEMGALRVAVLTVARTVPGL